MLKTESAPLENDKEWVTVGDDELITEVRRRLTACAESLVALANVVGPAVRRGLDLGFVNPILLDVLRKIECQQIVPELAERFMHSRVFNRLKNLPLDDQKMIAETGKVDVVVRRGAAFDVRKMPVDSLTNDQAKLVFENGRMRSEAEMISILEDTPEVESDPYDEAKVSVKIVAEIEMTKAQRKRFNELKDKAGGITEFVRRMVIQRL